MKAWLFQDHRQKQQMGESAPWYVGWYDPDGKKKRKRIGSRSMAEKYQRRCEGELAAGTYNTHQRKTWADFRAEFESRVGALMDAPTRREAYRCLDHFQRIAKPARLSGIKTKLIDDFIAKRKDEDSKRHKGQKVSPATVNKELRHLKAALAVAVDWGYLPKVPKARMLREPKKLPRYVTAGDFAKIYQACNVATMPAGQFPFDPEDWWKALLIFARMTGWRISEILALRRGDLDFGAGQAITRHDCNKGKRDEVVPLHQLVLDHLKTVASFEPVVFPWYHNRRTLQVQFHRIQRAAGLSKPWYGFHDIRRAFATMNADRLSANELQAMMRHSSPATTQGYINMAKMLNRTAEKLDVPVFRKTGAQ